MDRRESTLNEAGDFIFPKQEGAIDDDHILGEIGDVLAKKIKDAPPRRISPCLNPLAWQWKMSLQPTLSIKK